MQHAVIQDLWKRLKREYVPELQARTNWPRYLTDEELAQLVEDVSCIEEEDEVQGELFDDPDDIDYESQHTDVSDHDSDSEVDMDPTEGDHDGVAKAEMDDLDFYIGKYDENVWVNKTVATVSKTKSKNVIKSLPGPKGQARLSDTT
nr:unnamed protein product [Callosobruchus analis]